MGNPYDCFHDAATHGCVCGVCVGCEEHRTCPENFGEPLPIEPKPPKRPDPICERCHRPITINSGLYTSTGTGYVHGYLDDSTCQDGAL